MAMEIRGKPDELDRVARVIGEERTMRILNLFADADGESHFREIDIDCTNETPWGLKISKRLPATAILFCRRHGHGR